VRGVRCVTASTDGVQLFVFVGGNAEDLAGRRVSCFLWSVLTFREDGCEDLNQILSDSSIKTCRKHRI